MARAAEMSAGGVAEDADSGLLAGCGSHFFHGSSENVGAGFAVVAPAADAKEIPQADVLELGAADAAEVPGSNAEHGASGAEMLEHGADARQGLGLESLFVRVHVAAQMVSHFRQARAPCGFRNPGQGERVSQDADIHVAVRDHSFECCRPARDVGQHLAKAEVMHCVGAVQQRAIDVEEIRVEGVPVSVLYFEAAHAVSVDSCCATRWCRAAVTRVITPGQSPSVVWRNSMSEGYQGLSLRPAIQRQSA